MIPPTVPPPMPRRPARVIIPIVVVAVLLLGGGYLWHVQSIAQQSASAMRAAQQAANQGLFRAAETHLGKIAPGEPTYQQAQKDIKLMQDASLYFSLRKSVLSMQNRLDTDMSQYWSDYNATIKPDNAAWDMFPTVDSADTATASPYVTAVSNDASNVSSDFNTLEVIYGDATSNAATLGALSQAVASCRQMSVDVDTMSTDLSDEWSALQSGTYSDYSAINQYIGGDNKLLNPVDGEQTKVDGLLTQYASAAFARERRDIAQAQF